jgi:hypothetical protein
MVGTASCAVHLSRSWQRRHPAFPQGGSAGMVPKSSTMQARGGMARWHGGVRGSRSPAPKSRSCLEITRVKRGRRLPRKRTVTLRPPKNEGGTLFILCSLRQVGSGPFRYPVSNSSGPLLNWPLFAISSKATEEIPANGPLLGGVDRSAYHCLDGALRENGSCPEQIGQSLGMDCRTYRPSAVGASRTLRAWQS